MREYGKVAATFWTGETGRKLRSNPDAQVVAVYLITGPMSNWIGLYHLPMALIAHHTGLGLKGASKALRRVVEAGFCHYDAETETVWIPEMAAYQVGEELDDKDNRVKGIIKEWQSWRKHPYYKEFHRRYAKVFHLPEMELTSNPAPCNTRSSEAPPKPRAGAGAGDRAGIETEYGGSGEAAPPPSPPPPAEPVVMVFPVVGKNKANAREWGLTESHLADLRDHYPTLDVLAEVRKSHAWVLAKPANRKTFDGMPKFLVNWLNKATNQRPGIPPPRNGRPTRDDFFDVAMDQAYELKRRQGEISGPGAVHELGEAPRDEVRPDG